MKPTPQGWPRLSSTLFYDDAPQAIEWLCRAFGFEVRLKVEGDSGEIIHSELTYGDDALIMVTSAGRKKHDMPLMPRMLAPAAVGGANTQSLMLFVDDTDAHCAQARAAGAVIIDEPKIHDYGPDYWADRSYGALDLEGHQWWFTQRVRDPQ
jgi:uncharacterized glyoxalase superfamily protein PhnB